MKYTPDQLEAMLSESQLENTRLRNLVDGHEALLHSLQAEASVAASVLAVAKDKPLNAAQITELQEAITNISAVVNPPPPPPAEKPAPAATTPSAPAPAAPAAASSAPVPLPAVPKPATPAPAATAKA